MDIDIKGIDKAELLAALYNNSRPLGMGRLQARPGSMTAAQARELIDSDANPDYEFCGAGKRNGEMYFDYLHGRPLKVDASAATRSRHTHTTGTTAAPVRQHASWTRCVKGKPPNDRSNTAWQLLTDFTSCRVPTNPRASSRPAPPSRRPSATARASATRPRPRSRRTSRS